MKKKYIVIIIAQVLVLGLLSYMCATLERKTVLLKEQNNEASLGAVDEKGNEEPNEIPSTEGDLAEYPATTETNDMEENTTEGTTTERPATEPPATEPPVTEPPTTEPPATELEETKQPSTGKDDWSGGDF